MELYTFITKEEYNILLKDKVLYCDTKKATMPNEEECFKKAYDYMADKLEHKYSKKNIKNAPKNLIYPRWAFYQWESETDLIHSANKSLFEDFNGKVLLKLNVPKEQVLLSDYDNWHYCLNGWYLPKDERDLDNWFYICEIANLKIADILFNKSNSIYVKYLQKRIYNSWRNIFNLNYPNMVCDGDLKSTQAVFWKIDLDNVLEVKKCG